MVSSHNSLVKRRRRQEKIPKKHKEIHQGLAKVRAGGQLALFFFELFFYMNNINKVVKLS